MIEVNCISALEDNQVYFVKDIETGESLLIDPSETEAVDKYLKSNKVSKVNYIINTHHHHDHVGGNLDLKKKYGAKVLGNKDDFARIPGFDEPLEQNFTLGKSKADVLNVPGHTKTHIALYFQDEQSKHLFCGDTLFVAGCGKVFDGTSEQLFESLKTLSELAPDTFVYCGHDYCFTNLLFALSLEPDNPNLDEAIKVLEDGKSLIPSTIALEKKINPFLRIAQMKKTLNLARFSDLEVFRKIRDLKNSLS